MNKRDNGLHELALVVNSLEELSFKAAELRKQRDELIRTLTQPPHNHTLRAVGEAAGITHQAVAQIKQKGERNG